ncbi:MAG: Stealth CR1 domain-containing protein [Coprococcus catus]|nr:Stealth CR1 domain-containing protein [Coprococcus catus]
MTKYSKILIYIVLLSALFDNMLIDFLRLPSAIRYINDVIILFLLLNCLKESRKDWKQIGYHLHQNGWLETVRGVYRQPGPMNVMIAILFFSLMLIPGLLINGGSPLHILWAVRNYYRFFAFYIICIHTFDKDDVINILELFCKIYYVNLVLCLIECFVFGKTRDYLGGIFGVSKGCNGYLNVFLCIVLSYVCCKYMKMKVSTAYMAFILISTMLIAGLAELKIIFIEMVIIVGLVILMHRHDKRIWVILKFSIAVIAIGLVSLLVVAPDHFFILINPLRLFEYAGSKNLGYNLSRFHAFSNINQLFFHGNPLLNLFGLGFGNCEYSSFSFLQSPFYGEYGQYNYRWFMHQMLFLETGYLGLLGYIGTLAAVVAGAWKNRNKQRHEFLHEFVVVMGIIAIMNVWYDASLRSECAYMIWFVLATSAIVVRKDDDKMRQPIDFVIAWVDGNDVEWQKEKNRYLHPDDDGSQFDASATRYRDWENLRYWFRAVDKYAPWVRKIHLITCGHKPEWLNTEAPKLHLVKHSDYIPEEYLPTFSSHPIELNLHRIPGLSEQFVYFNDDFFLNAPVEPEDFFVDDLPCDSLEEKPMTFPAHLLTNSVFVNDLIFANEHFQRKKNKKELWRKWYSLKDPHVMIKNMILSTFNDETFLGLNIHHLPQAYLKKTFKEVWELEPKLLAETCSHRFRDERDVSQCVFKFWQLLNGRFYNYNKRKFGRSFLVSKMTPDICQAIRNHQYKAICINDSDNIDFEKTKQMINEAFEEALPEKSVYER